MFNLFFCYNDFSKTSGEVSMSNVLEALLTMIDYDAIEISSLTGGNNRANNMGEGLEKFVQDIFAGTLDETDPIKRMEKLKEVFSYQGNKNNPPDLILKHSDAIEIKKIESLNSTIAFNSSYPKEKLYADSPMITKACKTCEPWQIKEILYVIGYIPKGAQTLRTLWMVYGDCFCADKETYERIKHTISNTITDNLPSIEFAPTNELGKVKKVDPLGITDLRIRGMWHIDNPHKIFDYLYRNDANASFELIILMRKEAYTKLPESSRKAVENCTHPQLYIRDVHIKNPNNPVQLIDAKLITYKVLS
jgi:hypothetical protein